MFPPSGFPKGTSFPMGASVGEDRVPRRRHTSHSPLLDSPDAGVRGPMSGGGFGFGVWFGPSWARSSRLRKAWGTTVKLPAFPQLVPKNGGPFLRKTSFLHKIIGRVVWIVPFQIQ